MRKAAGLKRGSRKKQQNEEAAKEAATVNSNSTTERRKPTTDEAALTSKNYRLAKELVSINFSILTPNFVLQDFVISIIQCTSQRLLRTKKVSVALYFGNLCVLW
jgi:leucyl aminopeptidase